MRLPFDELEPAAAVAACARALHEGGVVSVEGPEHAVSLLVSDVLDISRRRRAVVDCGLELAAAAQESGVDYFSFAQMEDLWARVRPVKDVVSPRELLEYLVRRRYGLYVIHGLEEELRASRVGPVAFSSQTAMLLRRAAREHSAGILYWGRLDTKSWGQDRIEPLEIVYDPPLPEVQPVGPRSRPSGLS